MRELPCDFCGDDADGVYEPLPGVEDGRRVSLCAACRKTLDDLLDPLTEGTNSESRNPASPASASEDERDARVGSGNEGGGANASTDAPEPRDEPAGRDSGSDESGDVESGADGTESADDGPSDADESTATTRAEEPPGFRKVMRLLNNRSFPLERAVAVELASGAYDLSEAEVETTLEYAVERGVLAASEGKLRRP